MQSLEVTGTLVPFVCVMPVSVEVPFSEFRAVMIIPPDQRQLLHLDLLTASVYENDRSGPFNTLCWVLGICW